MYKLNNNSSEILEGKFYIINEKWFSEYKKFFLYDNIYQILSPKIDNISIFNNETTIRMIYNNNKNKNKEFSLFLNDNTYLNFDFRIDNINGITNLSNQYSFINEKILEKIISPQINKKDINICEYYINNKKLIIKCGIKYILIGDISWINKSNLFIPEIVLEYNDEISLNNQFKKFKKFDYDIRKELNLIEGQLLGIKEINSNKILGHVFLFNKIPLSPSYNINQSNFDNNANNEDLIKLLLNIYLNNEYIKYKLNTKIKNEQFEICYIVNKKYIDKLKEISEYEEFCKSKIKEIFDKYKIGTNNYNELLNNSQLYEEIIKELYYTKFNGHIINKKIIMGIKHNYEFTDINKIYLDKNNNEQLYYFKDFEIISANLYQIFEEQHLTLNDKQMIKTKCLFGDNKIIFYPSLSLVNCLIIANYNSKNEFNFELLLYYDNSNDLKNHINQIKQIGYGNVFSNLS